MTTSMPAFPAAGAAESTAGQRRVAQAVTALFVPGDRPERYAKAATAGPGVVIIDLEDAVAPQAKAQALESVLSFLGSADEENIQALVRVNPVGTQTHAEETTALLELATQDRSRLLGLVVPKAENPQDLHPLGHRLGQMGLALVPLVESALGVVHALDIAQVPGVTRLAFGAVDYALDIDADVQGEERVLDYPRSVLVTTSRAAGVAAPLDSPAIEITDAEPVAEAARLARAFGFGGKLCIHPRQVKIVEEAFRPAESDLQWARTVIGVGDGTTQVNGQMIDRPVIERARRLLARAAEEQS